MSEDFETVERDGKEVVEFDKENVKGYLDNAIDFWRDKDDSDMAKHYVDAYQCVRDSLFGELKE